MLTVLFGFFGALILIGAVWVVALANLFRAALSLGLVLVGVAAVFLLLEAEFLAFVQILVYVGAILTLLVFGVMLTSRIADPSVPRWNRQAWAALPVTAALGLGLAHLLFHAPWPAPNSYAAPAALPALGKTLLSTYLLPFEVLSLLLLGALVGAVFIARKEPE